MPTARGNFDGAAHLAGGAFLNETQSVNKNSTITMHIHVSREPYESSHSEELLVPCIVT
jgi:hypothetical protein